MKQNLQDEMFDAMLRSALRDHHEEDLLTEEELRAQGMETHQFSPEFEKKMNTLIRKVRRREWLEKQGKWVQRTAAMFAALIVGIKRFWDIDD